MKALREGFTTGSCAAAAALASCLWQRDGVCPERVSIVVPAGRTYAPEIVPHEDFLCGVIKDAGDDPDITNGAEICACVNGTWLRVACELAEDDRREVRAAKAKVFWAFRSSPFTIFVSLGT